MSKPMKVYYLSIGDRERTLVDAPGGTRRIEIVLNGVTYAIYPALNISESKGLAVMVEGSLIVLPRFSNQVILEVGK